MPTRRIAREKPRRKARKAPSKAKAHAAVSRHEYAELCLHIAKVESLATRNRTDLDIQLRRIAQLQDELDAIKKVAATTAIPADALVIPLPKTGAES